MKDDTYGGRDSDYQLAGLNGGQKAKWLSEHREEVISFYGDFGPDASIPSSLGL